jgi:hypothetical protein
MKFNRSDCTLEVTAATSDFGVAFTFFLHARKDKRSSWKSLLPLLTGRNSMSMAQTQLKFNRSSQVKS